MFENHVTDCRVDGKAVQLALWDTAGQEEYERLRPLSYSKANVILVAYALDDPESLANAGRKWIQEVTRYLGNEVPVVLVGLKSDLRGQKEGCCTWEQGMDMSRRIGAKKFLECSALTGDGVDDVFEAATRNSLLYDRAERESASGCCTIL